MLPEGLPEKTLGWQVLDWGSTYLAQPDGRLKGDLWEYSDEQALFLLWYYAVDENGHFLYRNAVLERPKGWGKSPLLAAMAVTEFLGPCRFDGWDAYGNPVAIPAYSPLVQIAAISDSQADNTYALCREMMLEGELIDEVPGLEVMLAKSTAPGNRKLEKVTASPRGREGNRGTFVVMDETHLWVPAENGPKLYEALARNLVKMNARWVETTNAPVPGENSVAETSHDAYDKMLAGEAFDSALLFDTREVYIDDIYDAEKAYPALRYVYGDAADPNKGWINLERVFAEINDPRTREHVARRFYFNQRTEGTSTWLRPADWQGCHSSTLKALKKGDQFALGFKSGGMGQSVSVVACRLVDQALFLVGHWERPHDAPDDWEADVVSIDSRVRKYADRDSCEKLLADPSSFGGDITGRWFVDFKEKMTEEFFVSSKANMVKAVSQFEDNVLGKRLAWNDANLNRHVMNCHVQEWPMGDTIRKETKHSNKYISAAQAAVLALEGAVRAVEAGALKEKPSSYVYSF